MLKVIEWAARSGRLMVSGPRRCSTVPGTELQPQSLTAYLELADYLLIAEAVVGVPAG